jgi:hypothetical protein
LEYTPVLACRWAKFSCYAFALGNWQQPEQIIVHAPAGNIIHATDSALWDIEAIATAGSEAIFGAPRLYGLCSLNLDAKELIVLLGYYIVPSKILVGRKHVIPAPQQRASNASYSYRTNLA